MLIAEALASKKDLKNEVNDLQVRITTAAIRFEDDDDKDAEDPQKLLGRLREVFTELQDLTVRINEANNNTYLKFEKNDLSVMEAIALRERLVLEQRSISAIRDASVPYNPFRGRTKDDVKTVRRLDVKPLRKEADALAKRIRQLDMEIQKVNWSAELA